jgi:hypothetical protein
LQPRGMRSAGPGDDQARFLADLRALRDSAAIGYEELAARAHYPSDVLKEAENGPFLPSLPVLAAYVRACQGNVPEWEERWRRLGDETRADPNLPVRSAGTSAAAVAGARAGIGVAPPEPYDPERIRAALRGNQARSAPESRAETAIPEATSLGQASWAAGTAQETGAGWDARAERDTGASRDTSTSRESVSAWDTDTTSGSAWDSSGGSAWDSSGGSVWDKDKSASAAWDGDRLSGTGWDSDSSGGSVWDKDKSASATRDSDRSSGMGWDTAAEADATSPGWDTAAESGGPWASAPATETGAGWDTAGGAGAGWDDLASQGSGPGNGSHAARPYRGPFEAAVTGTPEMLGRAADPVDRAPLAGDRGSLRLESAAQTRGGELGARDLSQGSGAATTAQPWEARASAEPVRPAATMVPEQRGRHRSRVVPVRLVVVIVLAAVIGSVLMLLLR